MTNDEDIYNRARSVIAAHGSSALYFSNGCLEEARGSGNTADADNWRRIIAAIQFLQLDAPPRAGMN